MRAHDGEYAEFVGARGTALLRTAHLLARTPSEAEDLLQTALVTGPGNDFFPTLGLTPPFIS